MSEKKINLMINYTSFCGIVTSHLEEAAPDINFHYFDLECLMSDL